MDSAIQPTLRYGSENLSLLSLKRTREMREIEIRFLVFFSPTGPYAYLERCGRAGRGVRAPRYDNYISANTELDLTRQKGLSSPTS